MKRKTRKQTKRKTALKRTKKSPKKTSKAFDDKVVALAEKTYRIFAPYYTDQDLAWHDAWHHAYGRLTYKKRGMTIKHF